MKNEALYPFGYGLSYNEYVFSDLASSNNELTKEGMDLSVRVKNTGKFDGRETVQVYVKAELEGTPNAQLKAFTKIDLQPGEEKEVRLLLPVEAFALYDETGKQKVLPGSYTLHVGGSQPDTRSIALIGSKPMKIVVNCTELVEL